MAEKKLKADSSKLKDKTITPYKGVIVISCSVGGAGCLRNLKEDVQPGCMDCPKAVSRVVDLEGKDLFEYRSPEERTGSRKPGKQKTEGRGQNKAES